MQWFHLGLNVIDQQCSPGHLHKHDMLNWPVLQIDTTIHNQDDLSMNGLINTMYMLWNNQSHACQTVFDTCTYNQRTKDQPGHNTCCTFIPTSYTIAILYNTVLYDKLLSCKTFVLSRYGSKFFRLNKYFPISYHPSGDLKVLIYQCTTKRPLHHSSFKHHPTCTMLHSYFHTFAVQLSISWTLGTRTCLCLFV